MKSKGIGKVLAWLRRGAVSVIVAGLLFFAWLFFYFFDFLGSIEPVR